MIFISFYIMKKSNNFKNANNQKPAINYHIPQMAFKNKN